MKYDVIYKHQWYLWHFLTYDKNKKIGVKYQQWQTSLLLAGDCMKRILGVCMCIVCMYVAVCMYIFVYVFQNSPIGYVWIICMNKIQCVFISMCMHVYEFYVCMYELEFLCM